MKATMTMKSTTMTLTMLSGEDDAGIAVLQLSSAESTTLSPEVVDQLRGLLSAPPPEARVIVVRGGPVWFSAGARRESLLAGVATRYAAEVPGVLLSGAVPLVAALEGHAVGGGWALGLLADVALHAEESLYGLNFVQLGFSPGMSSTAVLEEHLPAAVARELVLSGRLATGAELAALGLRRVVARSEVWPQALEVARGIASAPPEAVGPTRRHLSRLRLARLQPAIEGEAACHAALFAEAATAQRIGERYES